MSTQERLELINQRLDLLNELNLKINKIIELLSPKNNSDPLITFTKANNVENTFIEDRQKEIFQQLDNKE